ncbi:hypothetical protein K466DRAFT_657668, partial [Polyporus arcularius HHB13444]
NSPPTRSIPAPLLLSFHVLVQQCRASSPSQLLPSSRSPSCFRHLRDLSSLARTTFLSLTRPRQLLSPSPQLPSQPLTRLTAVSRWTG